MNELTDVLKTAKDVGTVGAVILGILAIVRILIRSITGSVSIRENTLQQLFIKILEQSATATSQTQEATEQTKKLTELLVSMEQSIEKHTEVMQKQAETNGKLFEVLVRVFQYSELTIPPELIIKKPGENGESKNV